MVYGGGNQNRYGYANGLRTGSAFGYGTASEHIVKYGASYYIDGGDRGTVKLFSHGTPQEQEIFGLKRKYSTAVGAGNTTINLTNALAVDDPRVSVKLASASGTTGLNTSYYIGAKVITSDPLDQNIEITYVNTNTGTLYLNSPLNSTSHPNGITIIPNRVTPLVLSLIHI